MRRRRVANVVDRPGTALAPGPGIRITPGEAYRSPFTGCGATAARRGPRDPPVRGGHRSRGAGGGAGGRFSHRSSDAGGGRAVVTQSPGARRAWRHPGRGGRGSSDALGGAAVVTPRPGARRTQRRPRRHRTAGHDRLQSERRVQYAESGQPAGRGRLSDRQVATQPAGAEPDRPGDLRAGRAQLCLPDRLRGAERHHADPDHPRADRRAYPDQRRR